MYIIQKLKMLRDFYYWSKRGYSENAPQFVKEKLFFKHGIRSGIWVETGTYLGVSTEFFSKYYSHVYSIEPSQQLFQSAKEKFNGLNVTLYNKKSEDVLPIILPNLSGEINFWLDGHYSAGSTFKGDKSCPIEDELHAIKKSFHNFKNIVILIDDVRCFDSSNHLYNDYPSLNYLTEWANEMGMSWTIENDVFIMKL